MQDSVAVVVFDAVRSDFFAEEFAWLPGRHYEQVYSTSHWTVPAFASLLTGQLPRETGTYAGSPSFFPPTPSLPKQLSEAGYKTRLYTANLQLVQWEGWTDGFEDVFGPETPAEGNIFNWAKAVNDSRLPGPLMYPEVVLRCLSSDCSTAPSLRDGWRRFRGETRISADRLIRAFSGRESTERSEFALFNFMDVHSSMRKNPGEAIASGVSDPEPLATTYRTAVQDLSDSYRTLFEELYREFDWVITLADHGELLGEHDLCGHPFGLYPELVQIPLVISSRKKETPYPTDALVSLVDIPATIRDIAGVERTGRGKSLFETDVRDRALVERLGQPHLHEEMFKRNGIWSKFDEYDIPLRGVVIDRGGYAYETGSGVVTTEAWERDREPAIAEAFEGIATHTTEDGDLSVSEDVEERLRELGYA